jgi:hypothetical protein
MMELETHCGSRGCICTHTHGCDRGWVFMEYTDEIRVKVDGLPTIQLVKREGVRPCQMCDSERYEIWFSSKNSREYHDRLRDRSSHNRTKAYDNEERDKTRTL